MLGDIVNITVDRPANSVLFTGFKGANNSSCQLVNLMQGDKVLLTNSFGGILRDIDTLSTNYNRVIMFGLDKTLKDTIRFEKAAQQERDIIYSTLDLSKYVEAAKQNNLYYTLSDKPTAYLCNYAYYCMMKKMRCPVLLAHIPTAKNMSEGFMQKVVNVFSG